MITDIGAVYIRERQRQMSATVSQDEHAFHAAH